MAWKPIWLQTGNKPLGDKVGVPELLSSLSSSVQQYNECIPLGPTWYIQYSTAGKHLWEM